MAALAAQRLDPTDLRLDIERLDARTEAWITRIDDIHRRLDDLRHDMNARFSDSKAYSGGHS